MATVTFVKKARKDYPEEGIKKGESYYWWKFRFGSKNYSKTQPRPSQLTQSDFLSQIYGIDERIADMTIEDDFESEIEDIKSELETLQSECEERRDNMPEQLQDSETGELLQGRYDSVDEMISELDGIDVEVDEESIKSDLEKEGDESEEEFEEKVNQAINERKEEILGEIQGVCYNGE